MFDVDVIDDPAAAAAALEPIRTRLLSRLDSPRSAAALASAIGIPRQTVNYHLRALEAHGLVREAEQRKWGGLTERLMVAARLLDLGGGTAWYGDEAQQARGKEILGIPAEKTARSIVVLGYPITSKAPRPNPAQSGRHPLSEIVSAGRFGTPRT